MAVYSVNQATQMYVSSSDKPTKVAVGDDICYTVTTPAGEKLTTDIIGPGYIKTSKAVSTLNVKAPNPKITVGTVVAGDEYIVRLIIEGDTGMANAYIKTVGVVATGDAIALASDIANALTKAAKRDVEVDYTATPASGVVTIKPEVHWTLGKRFVVPQITVEVVCVKGSNLDKDLSGWVSANVAPIAGTGIKRVKDLEWFCAGERGDQYRGASYPNEIPFVSQLGTLADGHYITVIHYAYSGSNEAVQKSEKDIVIVTLSTTAPTI